MALTLERSPDWPSISDFYSRKNIFLTGATGFLGKCLVEKLLRCVPDIGRILVLIRPMRGKSAEERLRSVFTSKCFDKVKENSPEALEKVVPIPGNISEPGLGMGQEDTKLIQENVSVVFHLAATVKFDAPLRESLTMNVSGVKETIQLCRGIRKLEAVVHISTAFAHCNRAEVIEEVMYPIKIQPDKVLSLLDWMTDEQLDGLTPTMLEGRPNTYTYTKALAETVLQSEAQGLPLSIIRPSIVTSSMKEPYPGWVDCLHGATGLLVAAGKGMLRVLRCRNDGISDFVPVDLLNNVIISAGWLTGVAKPARPFIFQYTSGSRNPINWIELYPLVINSYISKPFDEIFRRPYIMKCRPACAWKYYHFLLHIVPAFFADLLLRIQGKRPKMMKLYKKLETAILQLDYFTQNYWDWSYANCEKLQSLLNDDDRESYNFDITKLVWKDYISDLTMGTKTFLLKEDPANLPIARRQITRLRNIRYTMNVVMLLVATRVLYIKSRIARELWSSMLGFCIQAVIGLSRFLTKL